MAKMRTESQKAEISDFKGVHFYAVFERFGEREVIVSGRGEPLPKERAIEHIPARMRGTTKYVGGGSLQCDDSYVVRVAPYTDIARADKEPAQTAVLLKQKWPAYTFMVEDEPRIRSAR